VNNTKKAVANPQEYDSKIPTNVRIVGELKDKIHKEIESRKQAGEENVSLAQIINESLAERYKDRGE
jgi:hypothetical protein